MNYRGRYKLYTLVGLAVLLMIQFLVFALLRPNMPLGIFLLFVLVIMMAFTAVLFTWLSIRTTKRRIEHLPESYKVIYVDANEMVGMSMLPRIDKKNTMLMILEIFEMAVIDERTVNEVIGDDFEKFVRGFIEAGGGRMTFLFMAGYCISLYTCYLFMMKVYKVVRHEGTILNNINHQVLDVGIVVFYGLVAFVFVPWLMYVSRKAAREQWEGVKRLFIIIPFIIPIGLVVLLIMMTGTSMGALLDIPLPILSTPLLISINVVMIGIGFLLMSYARKLEIKRIANDNY